MKSSAECLVLIRHPRVAVAPGTCYGRLDLDLGPDAEAEIAAALAALPRGRPVLTSPARRCSLLGDRVAARDGQRARPDPRLRELDFSAWEGRSWDAIDRAESDPWTADPWTVAPGGGETFEALHARVAAALADAPAGAILVTHAGPIRAARMILLGETYETVFATPVPHATPVVIERIGA